MSKRGTGQSAKEEDFASVSGLEKSLKNAQKESQKSIAGSFLKRPSEDDKIDVLEQDFYRLSEFVEQCTPIFEKYQDSIKGLKASGKEDTIESLGDCLKWSKELITYQLDRLNDETMNMPCLIKATDALYSGAIHLCDGLANILSNELSSKEISGIVDKAINSHHAASMEAASNLNQEQKVVGKSIVHKQDEDQPPKDRRNRIAKMSQATTKSGLDDVDGAAVEVVMEAVAADGALADVLRELKVGSVQAGEAKSAIPEKTHAAAAKEERDKVNEAGGRAG